MSPRAGRAIILAVILATVTASIAVADVWSSQSSGTSQSLNGVACGSGSHCIAVGAQGTVVASTDGGNSWSSQTSGITSDLEAVACPSGADCYAVGLGGTILVTSDGGSDWSAASSGTTSDLEGITCTSDSACVAVGDDGTILSTSDHGNTWTAASSPVSGKLYGVSCSGQTCVAVGAGGEIANSTDGGNTWNSQSSGTSVDLLGVACPDSNNCTAVGSDGTVDQSTDSGNDWNTQSNTTGNPATAIACMSDSTCLVTGSDGSIQATADGGSTWDQQTSATSDALNAVACQSGTCVAAGADGTVVTATAPSNTSAPSVGGSDAVGQTLTASAGSWQGSSQINYSYQWLSCDPNGSNCNPISSASSSTYQLADSDVGSTVEVDVTAENIEGSSTTASTATSLVEPSSGPACTDVWTAGSGAWETGSNWSTGSAPSGDDVACLRPGTQANISANDSTGVLQAAGATVTIDGGQLQLNDSTNASLIGTLQLNGGVFTNPGNVNVTSALNWTGGTITGAGTTTLESNASSTITPTSTSDPTTLDGGQLTNQGTLTFDCSQPTGILGASVLQGEDGAVLDNTSSGTLNVGDTSDNNSQLCALQQVSGSPSQVLNDGTLSAPEPDFVGWELTNNSDGSVSAPNQWPGALVLAGGQGPSSEQGTWSAQALWLAAGDFDFPEPNSVNVSELYTGTGNNDWASNLPWSSDLNGQAADTSAVVSLPSVDWPNTFLQVYGGTTTIGTATSPSDLDYTSNAGGDLTVTSPSDQASSLGYVADDNGPLTLYGANTASFVGIGWWDSSTPAADLYQEGTLSLGDYSGIDFVGPETLHQDGTLVLTNDQWPISISGSSWGEPTSQWPTVEGDGTIVTNDGTDPVQYCEIGLQADIIMKDQTIDDESPNCGFAFYGPGQIIENVTVHNYGSLYLYGDLRTAGSSIQNDGVVAADSYASVLPASDSPSSSFVNSADGSMTGVPGYPMPNPALVAIPFQNAGTVNSSDYIFNSSASNDFGPSTPSDTPNQIHRKCKDPVDCATGNQTEQETDLAFGGLGGLSLVRTYNSQLAASQIYPGMFGYGWTSSFEAHLFIDTADGTAVVDQPDGSTADFTTDSGGNFVPAQGVESSLQSISGGGYRYTLPNQEIYDFDSSGNLTDETNRAGLTTSLGYNSQGQLVSVTAASGRQFTFTYNDQGLVATATDPYGVTVSYGYDGADELTAVSYSAGPVQTRWQFGYDGTHELTSMTDGRGNTTQINYASSMVTSQTDPLNQTSTWSYSPGETVLTSPAGNVTDYLFNDLNEPVSETQGVGTPEQTTESYVYNSAGEPTAVMDGNGNTTTYTYDAAGNQTSETDPDGRTTSWSYDSDRDVLSEQLPSGLTTAYTYNSQGLPTQVVVTGPGGLSETTGYSYNGQAELTSQTDARGKTTSFGYDQYGDLASVTDPEGNQATYSYDADGRETASVSPAGNVSGGDPFAHTTGYGYDAWGDLTSVTDPDGNTTSYSYDGDQNLLSVTDPDNATRSYAYDADNQLTSTTLPDGTAESEGYDADGNLNAQTNGNGQTTTYAYTPLDQLQSETDPLNRTTSYTYDADGNLQTLNDAEGRTTTYAYDDADQPTGISYSDGSTPDVSYLYTPDGLVSSMTDGTGTTSYHYDGLDRLSSKTNGAGQTVSYGYNQDNQPDSIGYPNGNTVSETYDDDDRMQSVTDWNGNSTTFGYDPDSNLQNITYPSDTNDIDSFTYNNADQLTGIQMDQGSSTLASIGYSLDPAGLVTGEAQTGLPGDASTSYAYTANEQLQSAGSLDYGYDQAYNATEIDGQSGYQYDDGSELTSSPTASYAYDQLGDRTSTTPDSGGGATDYTYNQADEMTDVTPSAANSSSYRYDGTGELATETTGDTTDTYAWNTLGATPVLLTDGHTNYIYGPDSLPVEQIAADGTTTYLHHDQIGSTRLITDSSGDTAAAMTYSPFGQLAGTTGTAATDLGYAGQYTDPGTGLEYDQARWYDPQTAQFMSVDPLNEITQQAYAYAGDNPTSEADPSGLDETIPTTAGPYAGQSWAMAGGRLSEYCKQNPRANVCTVGTSTSAVLQTLAVGLACTVDVGLSCIDAGLLDLDGNLYSNLWQGVANPCDADSELKKSLIQATAFGFSSLVGGMAFLPNEGVTSLRESTAGQLAVTQRNGLATTGGTMASAEYGVQHPASSSAGCGCKA